MPWKPLNNFVAIQGALSLTIRGTIQWQWVSVAQPVNSKPIGSKIVPGIIVAAKNQSDKSNRKTNQVLTQPKFWATNASIPVLEPDINRVQQPRIQLRHASETDTKCEIVQTGNAVWLAIYPMEY
jgi:hypothetical protein